MLTKVTISAMRYRLAVTWAEKRYYFFAYLMRIENYALPEAVDINGNSKAISVGESDCGGLLESSCEGK